jgi:hypothetical protein
MPQPPGGESAFGAARTRSHWSELIETHLAVGVVSVTQGMKCLPNFETRVQYAD